MLTIIVTTLFLSLVSNIFLKKLNLPTIIGYIATGTIVAYGFNLHDAVHNHELKEIAEFGVVFLMFTIGLEFSVEHLKRMKNEVFVTGTLQILITTLFSFIISFYVLGIDEKTSFILSLAISLSSTAIILKTFNETGEINKRYGQRALGILIMQDIAVIPILLIIGFMSSDSSESISTILIEMLLSAVVLLTLLWFIGKYLLESFFTQIIKTNSDELFVGTILFLAIGSSYLAHSLGFSYSLGAFIAGMLIAETKYKHQAEADLIPFRDILLGIFFITVGMQIDFLIIKDFLHIILALLIVIMLMKFAIIFALVKINESKRTSLKTALSLVQVGEFSLALLELARVNSLVNPPYGQVMIITIVLSMVLTPILLRKLTVFADLFFKEVEVVKIDESLKDEFSEHVVIIGFGEFGQNIAKNLEKENKAYIAIENNLETYNKAKRQDQPMIFGNATKIQVIKSTYLSTAKHVIVAINNPKKLYHLCNILKKHVDVKKIIVKVHNEKERVYISSLGIENIIVENKLSSDIVVATLNE